MAPIVDIDDVPTERAISARCRIDAEISRGKRELFGRIEGHAVPLPAGERMGARIGDEPVEGLQALQVSC
jgi:hypothetical protein